MAWTTPPTWSPGQMVGASDMQKYVTDNPLYLLSLRPIQIIHVRTSNITTTSTSFVDVDATNIKATITMVGTRAKVNFKVFAGNPAGTESIMFDVIMDSTTRASNSFTPNYEAEGDGTDSWLYGTCIFTGVTPGTHDFKLQFKVTSGTGTVRMVSRFVGMICEEF